MLVIIPPQNECFQGVYWNQRVCPSMCPSVYKILVSVKVLVGVLLTDSPVRDFETVPNSKKQQTTTEMWLLTLSQTSPGFHVYAI